MEASRSSETLASIYQTIRYHIPNKVICEYSYCFGFLYFRNNFFSDNFVSYEDYNFILNMKRSESKNHFCNFQRVLLESKG
jgi:hypothetical protein